ncbi:MAG TPA: ATP-binding protein [Polyangiaceae bacterium]|nr:ATP-binding protein [Polyangiaceae bacterium]
MGTKVPTGEGTPSASSAESLADLAHGRLELADRLTTLGALSAAIGHELNNPLTYVIGNLKHVLEQLSGSNEPLDAASLVDAVGDALGGAERIARIVRDMSSLSRQGAGKTEPLDVEGVLEIAIRQTWNHIRHRARLSRYFEPVPLVDADVPRICQVFVNLLLNAAQAIPEGDARRNEISVTLHSRGEEVVVEITDTGVGIPEPLLERVFEPFFTTKPVGEGTGLGLSISRSIVQSFGGDLECVSQRGAGTTMRVRLPKSTLSDAPDAHPPALKPLASPLVTPSQRRARVLVVDDEPSVLVTVRRLLERYCDVETQGDSRAVLPYLSAGPRFDVLLCDLMMPEMTGLELFEEISKRSTALADRMLFMTAGAFTPNAQAFLETRPFGYVLKPFDPDDVVEKVRAVIEGCPGEAPSLPPLAAADFGTKPPEMFLRFPKQWDQIDVVRESCGFFARAAYRDVLVGQRVELVVHELVENAIRYAAPDEDHVEVDLHGSAGEFEVSVSSRSREEHVDTLLGVLAELNRSDPADAYVAAMQRYARSEGGGGLGLARVACEANVRLAAAYSDGAMRLVARGAP